MQTRKGRMDPGCEEMIRARSGSGVRTDKYFVTKSRLVLWPSQAPSPVGSVPKPASETEKAHVIATWPTVYQYEGPTFWIGQ